ncbi:putative 3',5'-cyclic phosphodiesterase pde-5 [Toxocara canis]|uniref:Phosphodiesterase n=1 Tax=Toxocara canis TaxID=6265 RepID=A0A0B2UZ40_TOXCA|nr:putative 3',5'-cyclic phosphodiesterase pde-5 [Toxocara canis]
MASELREQTVVNYLRTHPHFLENYVTGPNISKETFQRWATRRGAKIRSDSRKTITGPWLGASIVSDGNDGELNDSRPQQRKLNTFLLDVAKDIVSMDTVIMKVMNFAQKLTNADRASLFLVDQKTNELYARIFDVGMGDEEHVKINEDGRKEIRFPAGKGIGGYVASTGQGLNIENAYEDPRFNKEIDQKTGYKTKNILCMPIFIRGSVIGVVQMVNKNDGSFTKQDECSFETFAVYCGLALHHAKLYDRIKRSEQKYRVALEVLAYHSVCNKDEVTKLKNVKLRERIVELETFDFNGMKLSELEKPLYAVYMFKSLFNGVIRYDYDDLVRFVLTVRKNYRRVAYHNWAHGWSVAHAMFVLLKATTIFAPKEALALYVACICHDLDHRGKNNAYMKTMSTPLAAVYSTSVMEHHHFNQTVTILQQDGHNILKSLSSDEYKRALSLIKHCILATDLALFFPNKAALSAIVNEKAFDWQNNEHRALVQAVLMTGCDLIASAKPWAVQTETVKVIFEEFYEQGDAERMNGKEPIAMMDRQKAHELPQMQVGFMNGICMPCYDLLSRVIPETEQLRERCKYNAKKWEELAEEQKQKTEEMSAN